MTGLTKLIAEIQSSSKTVFIFCGYPYAGKSFVADKILSHIDIAFVSIDEIFTWHGFSWSDNSLPAAKDWDTIFKAAYEQTTSALQAGNNVLYDSTNQTVESRDVLRAVAQSAGADAKVIYVVAAVETVWKRWEENRQQPTRSVVSRELVQQTIDMFEEPNEHETVIVVNNS